MPSGHLYHVVDTFTPHTAHPFARVAEDEPKMDLSSGDPDDAFFVSWTAAANASSSPPSCNLCLAQIGLVNHGQQERTRVKHTLLVDRIA